MKNYFKYLFIAIFFSSPSFSLEIPIHFVNHIDSYPDIKYDHVIVMDRNFNIGPVIELGGSTTWNYQITNEMVSVGLGKSASSFTYFLLCNSDNNRELLLNARRYIPGETVTITFHSLIVDKYQPKIKCSCSGSACDSK